MLVFLLACTNNPQAPADPLADRGKSVYVQNCIACHNVDPAQPGALGPALRGSSRELVEARVLHASYPPGYAPKRTTTTMVAFPQLSGEIDALSAYLK